MKAFAVTPVKTLAAAAAVAVVAGFAGGASAQTVQAGTLTCNVASGWGFIIGSSKDLKCTFSPGTASPVERYTGTISKFGADIGYTQSGVIVWAVFAPTNALKPGALSGSYAGATAEATVGAGLGANVLVGGGNSIALQPLSISGQEGLNVAAGIAGVTLKYVK